MITISQSDSIEKCTVGSTYLFIHYSKGVMLVEQTSLNNFCQSITMLQTICLENTLLQPVAKQYLELN